MSDPEKPWMKFHPADWRSDPALRLCSLAARGLWIECIAIMHRAQPYGHLLINGRPVTDAQLAVSVGAPPEQIPALVRELSSAGVFSRTRKGVIYSRRMTRDEKKAKISRKNGKKGGNAMLCKQRENPPWDNPPLKPPDKPKSLESRVRVKKEEAVASSKKAAWARSETPDAGKRSVPDMQPGLLRSLVDPRPAPHVIGADTGRRAPALIGLHAVRGGCDDRPESPWRFHATIEP